MSVVELDELESQLLKLMPGLIKHNMEPGYAAMAEWLRGLPPDRRARIFDALPSWLLDRSHPWHSQAAIEMAVRLSDRRLLEAAIDEAVRQGINEIDRTAPYPPWLVFDLGVISAISRWSGDAGEKSRAYLGQLRSAANTATSYPSRLLAIRAWLTDCLLNRSSRDECIARAIAVLRTWRDERLFRSAVSLLHAYFSSDIATVSQLRKMLTAEELASAWPQGNPSM